MEISCSDIYCILSILLNWMFAMRNSLRSTTKTCRKKRHVMILTRTTAQNVISFAVQRFCCRLSDFVELFLPFWNSFCDLYCCTFSLHLRFKVFRFSRIAIAILFSSRLPIEPNFARMLPLFQWFYILAECSKEKKVELSQRYSWCSIVFETKWFRLLRFWAMIQHQLFTRPSFACMFC